MAIIFTACREKVLNRGRAPQAFLEELVLWGRAAPDEIFASNPNYDVYSHVKDELGPWAGDRQRRAVMLEVLRVLGGFESSWNWNEGVDITNPASVFPCTMEAGIFQCSGNSMNFDQSLKALVRTVVGSTDCVDFRKVMKANHVFAFDYTARLLRFTVRHHGPLRDRKVHPWLSRDAVDELMSLL